ncbi:hypothetical protein BDF19DRAFT_415771 [Syncephalis fuscata]|nr:hypothetical protein BDF19DRAFT_415771 [Syncephalis fuscata]
MSSSLDTRVISSPLAALSMVATSSLEGRDLYFLSHEASHATASAPASHAGSAPSSPSVGPTHMDDLGYHHRKRKCLAAEDHSHLPERAWSPKARSPLGHVTSTGSERLPPMSSWSDHGRSSSARDDNPYPSPRLPAILPATSSGRHHPHHYHHQQQHESGLHSMRSQHTASGGLASLLNPTDANTSPSLPRSHGSSELLCYTLIGFTGPSSPGRDSLYGNESPNRAGSVDGGSRSATPTSGGTLHMTPEERRRRRLERNRLAARECRQKKKVYVQELEDRMERMESENRRLRKEIEELNAKLTLGSMHLDRRGMFEEARMAGGRQATTPMATDGSTSTDRSTASPVASMGTDGIVPTPPPSNGSYVMSHPVDILSRDLSVSPILPKPVIPLSHGRPHSDSWSSV